MSFFKFTRVSSNSKTGPIPTTISDKDTCPVACPLKGSGCYAELGMVGLHWNNVSKGKHSGTWGEMIQNIYSLPKDQLWRHNVAGDLAIIQNQYGESIHPDYADDLIQANYGRKGFTYTHHDVLNNAFNAAIVRLMNQQGFTVNLSANNLENADELKALNIGPVCTIMPENCDKVTKTPAGNTVIQCPATYNDSIQCVNCGICQKQREAIIGFPVHGVQKKKAHRVFMINKAGNE